MTFKDAESLIQELNDLNKEKEKYESEIKHLEEPKELIQNYRVELNTLRRERQEWSKKIMENQNKLIKKDGIKGVLEKIEELKVELKRKEGEALKFKHELRDYNKKLDELFG